MKDMFGNKYKLLFWVILGVCLFWGATQVFSASFNLRSSELVINELLATNGTGLTDEDGDLSDWVEIHNPGQTPVNLSGWSLSDDPDQPEKWAFPNRTLNGDEYLLVFASGKNRKSDEPGSPLHTNFKLNKDSDFLGLYNILDRSWGDAISPQVTSQARYPQQFRDIAYGRYGDGLRFGYLATPTPDQPNDTTMMWEGLVSAVEFSAARGFYDEPFFLELSTASGDAVIRYTVDGREPTETSGMVYTRPISLSTTTPVRAAAFKPNYLSSKAKTHTYIFLEDVLRQPVAPPGYPLTWGVQPKSWRGIIQGEFMPADYQMDPAIVNDPRYRDTIRTDLLSIPTISIVTDVADFDTIYSNPRERGREWERPASIEIIDPAGAKPGAQVNAGLRIQGGEIRYEFIPKHAFRLFFRSEYGPPKFEYPLFDDSPVDTFETLVLRTGGGYAGRPGEDKRSQAYINDQWLRDTQREMSGVSPHGTFVHVYINGLYWGLYNIVERPDASFAASHFGGSEESWFAANHNGLISGPLDRAKSFQAQFDELGANLADPDNYAAIKEYLDIGQFIDYVILNWFVGNTDWPDTNWYMTVQSPDGLVNFFTWDGDVAWREGALLFLGRTDKEVNLVKPLFEGLSQNHDFRMEFADRAYKHLFHDGALTDANSQARWQEIGQLIDRAIVAESARWGDVRNDPPVTRDDWLQAQATVLARMEGNGAKFIGLLRDAGFYPRLDPPILNQQGGMITPDFELTMAETSGAEEAGTIYYTIDGSDPRLPVTGELSPQALVYDAPVLLTTTTTRIKARILVGGSPESQPVWSALNEATFRMVEQNSQLRITEIMYNPVGGDDFEFMELQNVGNSSLDVSGLYFEGIKFAFPSGTPPLAPHQIIVLARNPAALAERYPGLAIGGGYSGQLSNKGEEIVLKDFRGNVLTSVNYDDENGWPISPDGRGDSLAIRSLAGDPNDPRSWQASSIVHGSPGVVETAQLVDFEMIETVEPNQ